jgi:hypothetical protein
MINPDTSIIKLPIIHIYSNPEPPVIGSSTPEVYNVYLIKLSFINTNFSIQKAGIL